MNKLIAIFVMSCLIPVCVMTGVSKGESGSGFVSVKKLDGVWWFIGPDGEKFISVGVNHIEPHLYLAPYNKEATLKRYGEELIDEDGVFDAYSRAAHRFIEGQIAICRDLGFNTFGRHVHASVDSKLYMDKVFYVASFEAAPVATWQIRAGEGPLPDVFSPLFAEYVEGRVKEVVMRHRDSPNLIGYMYCDVPAWILPEHMRDDLDKNVMIYPWVNAMMSLGVGSPGKAAWVNHLRERYHAAAEAAKVWGLDYIELYGVEWEDFYDVIDWSNPANLERVEADMRTFMRKVAEEWYKMHYDAVRKYDKNHLIIGDKSSIDSYQDFLIPALRKYIDVVAIQSYNVWSEDKATADWIYEQLGKPIFNGDGGFAYVHPNQTQHKVKGWWTGAKNMEDVARMYREQMEMMMAEPYVVGWHHCGMMQQWDGSERGDVPSNENGFMDPFENYYSAWTEVIRDLNSKTVEMHREAKRHPSSDR